LLSASVAGAVFILVFVLAVEARQPAIEFASQVAAGAQKLFESGQREVAISALEEVLQRAPDSLIARRELAMELAASGKWSAAAKQLRLVLARSPSDPGASMKLAEALEKLGDARGALRYYRLACRLDPENGVRWMALAALLSQSGDDEEALRAAQRAVRFAQGVPEAQLGLGFARWRSGDLAGAAASFSSALELDPANPTALAALARLRAHPRRPPRTRRSIPLESARLISNPFESVE
jgi:Flp pilus assembly protein TadD